MHAGCIRLEGRTHVHMGGPPPRALWTASVPVNKRTNNICGMTHAGDILEGRLVVCWKDRVVVTCMYQFMPETSWRAMHAGCTWRAERMSRAHFDFSRRELGNFPGLLRFEILEWRRLEFLQALRVFSWKNQSLKYIKPISNIEIFLLGIFQTPVWTASETHS